MSGGGGGTYQTTEGRVPDVVRTERVYRVSTADLLTALGIPFRGSHGDDSVQLAVVSGGGLEVTVRGTDKRGKP
jgi:hypothetical protein